MMTVSIPSVAAMVALAASSAVGAHAGTVAGVLRGDDSLAVDVQPLYELAIDELDAMSSSSSRAIKSVPGWESFEGIPVVGTMTLQDPSLSGDYELTIGDTYNMDSRDVNSLYASAIAASFKVPIVLLSDFDSGGVLLQVVENRTGSAGDRTDGWYLAVHDAYDTDTAYPGYVRLIGHKVVEKAANFEFVNHSGRQVLRVKGNRDSTGSGTVGWYLSIPPNADRDQSSSFVAVGPNIASAVSVSMKPAFKN